MPSEAGGGAALAQQERPQQPLAQHPMATQRLASHQGIDFDALQAVPVASETRRPGILILPEMFGLNAPMQALADGWVESEPTDVSPDLGEKIRSANEKVVGLTALFDQPTATVVSQETKSTLPQVLRLV